MKNFTSLVLCFAFACSCMAAAPTITNFSPASASTGTTVTINGTNFTGITAVSFNGTAAASFNVISSTQMTAVVGAGSTGAVQVANIDGTGSKNGFFYITTSAIITDFGGYWSTSDVSVNPIFPDSSHNLLAFKYNGTIFSTGVNNTALDNHGIVYSPGNYKALPVAGISGVTNGGSTYIALARKVDGSAAIANTPAVSSVSVKNTLMDGVNGLDLGTGFTNLPASAILTFQINNINDIAVNDAEPDIILTQIAQPAAGNDQFSFIDASGNVVGNTITVDMTRLPMFGTYILDLFNLSPSTPYNTATAYSAFDANTTREIRLTGIKLSDFGITGGPTGNKTNVKALRITPSGNSDYAFVAYNVNAINLPPNVTQNIPASNTTICSGGTAIVSVIATASAGGALSFSWEESTNGGTVWNAVNNGGNYSGTATETLSIANAVSGNKYRTTVTETSNPGMATSADFTIVISTPATPATVTINGISSTCLNSPVQLTSNVTGGSNLTYQWQSNASGSYANISGATLNNYIPAVNATGSTAYRVQVSSGSGCGSAITATPYSVTVTGVSSVTSAQICGIGALTLLATATSGTIDWYDAEVNGNLLFSGNLFITSLLPSSVTYYVSASGCASALRVPVVATINPLSIGGIVDGGVTVIPGTNSTTLTVNNNAGSILKWQSSTDNFISSITDIAGTTSQYVVNNLLETNAYRVQIKNGICAAIFSAPAIINVMSTLPVKINSLKGARENNSIRIQWAAFSEQSTLSYVLEKSVDGINFSTVAIVAPANSISDVTYSRLDNAPVNGYNFYRVKEISLTGQPVYSSIIKILFDNSKSGITVYPNPVTDHVVTLQFNDMEKGMYKISIVNNAGQIVYQSNYLHPGGYYPKIIQLPATITTGIYQFEIAGNTGRNNFSVMVQ